MDHGSIDLFLSALKLERGASPKTIEAYQRDLMEFLTWCKGKSPTALLLDRFCLNLTKRGLAAKSIARKISCLRQYFKFLMLEGIQSTNPAERLESPRLPKTLPKALNQEQVQALMDAASRGLEYSEESKSFLNLRDLAMLLTLYATGLRVSELTGLKHQQVDLAQGVLRVRGKGGKERQVPFENLTRVALETYFKAKSQRKELLAQDAVFTSHLGKPLSRQTVWTTMKNLAASADLPLSKVSPHVLRHSFATHLLQGGMNLRSLQTLLGHSDLSTTQVYTQMTPGHLKKALKRYHPRGE